jgi:hypothetical protein
MPWTRRSETARTLSAAGNFDEAQQPVKGVKPLREQAARFDDADIGAGGTRGAVIRNSD